MPTTDRSTRDALLDAALGVFAERTYAGTAVPAIAERAGVAVGGLYRYWPGKEALANAVFRLAKTRFAGALSRAAQAGPVHDESSLRAVFDATWRELMTFADTEPQALRFLEHQQHASYLDDESRALSAQVEAMGTDLVRVGQELGVFRDGDPVVLTALVFGAYVGLTRAVAQGDLTPTPTDRAVAGEALWGLLRG